MHLTPSQRQPFDRDGYLFFPGPFPAAEVKVLDDAVPGPYARREVCNVREKGSGAVRTNFAAHPYSEPFARLARHPRMVEVVADCSTSRSRCASSGSTGRWRSRATPGSGTRIAAPAAPTT